MDKSRLLEFKRSRLVNEVQPVVIKQVCGRRPIHVDLRARFIGKIAERLFDGQTFA